MLIEFAHDLGNRGGFLANRNVDALYTGILLIDDANRADRDAFFSALSQNTADMGNYFQMLGKNMNQNQLNWEMENLIGQVNKYGYHFDRKTGKMTYNG